MHSPNKLIIKYQKVSRIFPVCGSKYAHLILTLSLGLERDKVKRVERKTSCLHFPILA